MIQDHRQPFCATIPIRITDLNYGRHVGNDALVSLIHEARVQYLNTLGYGETNFGDYNLILSFLEVKYKQQVFYPEVLSVSINVTDIKTCSFSLIYHFKNQQDQEVLQAKTEMVCYDYENSKIRRLPKDFVKLF